VSISISDLLTPQTATQVRTTLVNSLVALGIPADKWTPGGALSLILTVTATVYAGFTTLMAQAIGSGFLETATGGWLTLLAYYVYGVTRPAATFASGSLTLTNSGGGTYNYSPGQATFLDTTNGQTYTNTQAIALAPSSSQTITIACTKTGAIGSAPPGEITTLVTQMLGVTCTNASSVVGQDAMLDANLRLLCTAKLGALSVRGPRSAYAYAIAVAVNAVTGAPVNINRQSITRSSHTGTVSIVVASPSGVPDPNDVAGVVNSIESGVPGLSPPWSGARPDCVTVTVTPATGVAYTHALTVWALATPGLVATDVATDIANGLTTYLADFPVGGVTTDQGTGLWASGIEAQIAASAGGATIISVEGATDLALSAGQVPLDDLSVTVRLVSVA
jgi:hypothetical protein